jgi:hypothetical protein
MLKNALKRASHLFRTGFFRYFIRFSAFFLDFRFFVVDFVYFIRLWVKGLGGPLLTDRVGGLSLILTQFDLYP